MKRIIVNGPSRLVGELSVSGSKNAALPIIFACVITRGVSEIRSLPDIGDVRIALEIIKKFGARITRSGEVTYIDTNNLTYCPPNDDLVSKIRASTYLIGACLARFGECRLTSFGGCNFAYRPIDMHLDACHILGADIIDDKITAPRLLGNKISFKKQSVGATVNAIILAATASGETRITGFAAEPHIDALIDFLVSAGASIERTSEEIIINGRELHGGSITVIGDMIEAGSYLVAGLLTGGAVRVKNCRADDMNAFLDSLSALGAENCISGNSVTSCLAAKGKYVSIEATPYPGFPTDLQPIIAPLIAHNSGGEIVDTVWPTRFGYLNTLSAFGVNYDVSYNHAIINPSSIKPAAVTAPDLRGGAACLLCALVADGRSDIRSAEIVLRGYENLEQKLRSIGADIKIEDF